MSKNVEKKTQQDALLQVAENIQDYLKNWWDLPELWKSLAKAGTSLAMCQKLITDGQKLTPDCLDDVVELCNQFGMFLQALEPIEKGGEV